MFLNVSNLLTPIDYENVTIASTTYASPPTAAGSPPTAADSNNNLEKSTTCPVSEEALKEEKVKEQRFIREANNFLKLLAKKLHFGQAIINTSMFYLLKYTRIYPYTSINKYLVSASCLLLAAKVRNEPIPMEYLVEWYIWAEFRRIDKDARPIMSERMKQDYMARIQEQEFDILSELNFEVEVELPNKFIAKYCHKLHGKTGSVSSTLSKYAYMFMNDAFTTTAPLYYSPSLIAATVIYMAEVYMKKLTGKKSTKDEEAEEEGEEWFKVIDESLDLKTIIEVKDEIKKCYG